MRNREATLRFLEADDDRIRRECERSYYQYFKRAWHVVEPSLDFRDNWHIKLLCDLIQREIERVAARLPKTTDKIINISPRAAKSLICNVMPTGWAWTRFPFLRFINSSHSDDLAVDLCLKSRDVIASPWYQNLWRHRFQMKGDQNVKSHFQNDKGGSRFATSVGGSVVGHGADIIIADDLVDVKNAENEKALKAANEHYSNALYTRLNDQDVGVRILVQQRLNKNDTSGKLLKERPQDHEHICIPLEPTATVNPPELIQNYGNISFFEKRFSEKYVAAVKIMGTRAFEAQFNQNPQDVGGAVFKPEWWRHWTTLPTKWDQYILSWDMAFKGDKTTAAKKGSDYVVGQAWGRKGAQFYLLDQIRGQWDLPMTIKMFLSFIVKHPHATIKLVEDKANGPGVIATVQKKIPSVIAVNPEGSKFSRAHQITPLYEAGNVLLPPEQENPWIAGFKTEHEGFTGDPGNVDDQVDAATQALDRLSGGFDAVEYYETMLQD